VYYYWLPDEGVAQEDLMQLDYTDVSWKTGDKITLPSGVPHYLLFYAQDQVGNREPIEMIHSDAFASTEAPDATSPHLGGGYRDPLPYYRHLQGGGGGSSMPPVKQTESETLERHHFENIRGYYGLNWNRITWMNSNVNIDYFAVYRSTCSAEEPDCDTFDFVATAPNKSKKRMAVLDRTIREQAYYYHIIGYDAERNVIERAPEQSPYQRMLRPNDTFIFKPSFLTQKSYDQIQLSGEGLKIHYFRSADIIKIQAGSIETSYNLFIDYLTCNTQKECEVRDQKRLTLESWKGFPLNSF
jgi:hypothetical protein